MIGLIDVGGTKLLAAAADNGVIGPAVRRDTPQDDPITHLIAMLDEVRNGHPLEGIGMAVPGPFDRRNARLACPPGLAESWWNIDFRGRLGAHFNCSVEIENDANCAALAEAHDGAGRGYRNVAYFTVSTGIGSGIVHEGELVIGRQDTEGGHMVLWPRWLGGPACDCGAYGCLETLASGRAIARRFGAPAETLDNPEAWDEIGRWLGLAVVNTTALLDPDVFIFGGGVCNRWADFAPAMFAAVAAEMHLQPIPPIVRAELDDARNLHGALALLNYASAPS